jgi:hypothetical protein
LGPRSRRCASAPPAARGCRCCPGRRPPAGPTVWMTSRCVACCCGSACSAASSWPAGWPRSEWSRRRGRPGFVLCPGRAAAVGGQRARLGRRGDHSDRLDLRPAVLGAAGAGRLGRRVEDRPVWPVVAIMPALFTSALFDPKVEPVSSFVLRNAPGLLAMLVACMLPFRLRNDPLWRVVRTAVPAVVHRPFGRRWLPALPSWLRSARRPNLLLELLFIQVGYGVYTWIRNTAPSRVHEAVANGQDVLRAEHVLHLDIERSLNRSVLASDWLTETLEQLLQDAALRRTPRCARLALLAPPAAVPHRPHHAVWYHRAGTDRLLGLSARPAPATPGHGFHDSLRPGGDTDPFGAFTNLADQFAAMPSLHIGWSIWCALVRRHRTVPMGRDPRRALPDGHLCRRPRHRQPLAARRSWRLGDPRHRVPAAVRADRPTARRAPGADHPPAGIRVHRRCRFAGCPSSRRRPNQPSAGRRWLMAAVI